IFDPYVQIANRERDRSKGLGLGLAISKQACELLGLSLGVRSVLGRGSCFRIGVPASLVLRHDGSCAAPGASVQPKPVVKVGPWLQGRRVLLVDDDPMVQVAMLALLRGWSLDVRSATRGDDSVLAVCGNDWVPECVLCDFRLPGPMNGIEVLDWLQQQFPKAIGVLLTGELIQTVQQDAEDAGYLLLSKPVDAEVLAFTLGALLERRHEERNP
ncbi:response regulator, partial [Rhodoferax sp.]|uniref:ATP-binding response regulator n=1 Tax=Rhodoferax sp. TaxID=50421 RepID=UPI0026354E18